MHPNTCDVAVVGAGPSGSMAARVAAENGAEVILLEEHSQAGIPVYCGEGLSLNGFKDSGLEPTVEIVSQQITECRVYPPNKEFLELTSSEWVGYNIHRDVFDRVLSEKAVAAGAVYKTNTRVLEVSMKNKIVTGIIAQYGDKKIEIKANVVIGADGFASTIRKSAGLGRWFPDFCTCAQYRLGNLKLEEPEVNEFHLGREVSPGAYAWVFPKSDKVANVGLGVRRIHKEPTIAYLKRFIKSDPRFKEAEILMISGGITPASGIIEKTVSNGVMLVGDAAGQLIPCTGAGVHSGIVAGKIAGKVAAKASEEGDTSATRLSEYDRLFSLEWGKRIKDSRRVLEMLDKFSDEDLNTLAKVITSKDIVDLANGKNVAQVLRKLARRSPRTIIRLISSYIRG